MSWHLSVDDKFIYQHIPFDEFTWHCGDGNGVNSGDWKSIVIEICENPETNTKQAEDTAIALTVLLMKEFNSKPVDVVSHQHWSGKYCPRVILKRDGSFAQFCNRVTAAFNAPEAETPKKKENELFDSGSSTFNKEVVASIVAARKAGVLKADTYVDKAKNGTLTLQELTAIKTLIMKRAYLDTLDK